MPGTCSPLFLNLLLCQFLEGPTLPLLLAPCPLLKGPQGASSPIGNNRDESVDQAMWPRVALTGAYSLEQGRRWFVLFLSVQLWSPLSLPQALLPLSGKGAGGWDGPADPTFSASGRTEPSGSGSHQPRPRHHPVYSTSPLEWPLTPNTPPSKVLLFPSSSALL